MMHLEHVTNLFHFLNTNKDALSLPEAFFKIAAICVGGWWTYSLFVRGRKRFPRLKLTHRYSICEVTDKHRILRLTLDLKNESEVLLCLSTGYTYLQKLKPVEGEIKAKVEQNLDPVPEGEQEVRWPIIGDRPFDFAGQREVEPQESDELVAEFVVSKDVDEVLAYTWIENTKKPGRNIGWTLSTVIDLKKTAETPVETRSKSTSNQAKEKKRPGAPKR